MSVDMVIRYEPDVEMYVDSFGNMQTHLCMTFADQGRYIEYADVAGLVDALKRIQSLAEKGMHEEDFEYIERQARNELARWTA